MALWRKRWGGHGDILYCSYQEGELENLSLVKTDSYKAVLIFGTPPL